MRQDALALVRDPFPPLWPRTHWVKLYPASNGTLTCGDPIEFTMLRWIQGKDGVAGSIPAGGST